MDVSIQEVIKKRKSVRTYNGEPLRPEDRELLENCVRTSENPFGVPVEFRLLSAKEHGLQSPVILGADLYLAAKTARVDNWELGYGYSFESVCLFAASLGIGTVMLGGTLNRAAFEKAMEVEENEVMPVASPVGYPADKRSIRENMMRRALKADERLPFGAIFFDGSFEKGLTPEKAGIFADALEMTRWAPTAANRKPIRAVVARDFVHFYEKRSIMDVGKWDIQRVDMGIGLSHFDLTRKEQGIVGEYIFSDPGLAAPEGAEYIVSFRANT